MQLGAAILCWELILVYFFPVLFREYLNIIGLPLEVVNDFIVNDYVDFLVGSFVALIPILMLRQTDFFHVDLCKRQRPFSWRAFGVIFMFAIVASIFTSYGISALDWLLKTFFSYTLMDAAETASAASTSITVFLYSVVVAPICEELVFRGGVMRSLEKYGTGFAIVVSSVLFGVMHGNIVQLIDASVFGIFLGIAAKRYGIGMSILLHAASNLMVEIFAQMDAITLLATLSDVLYVLVLVGCSFGVVWFCIRRKNEVHKTLQMILPEQNIAYLLSSPTIILFLVFNFYFMISGLTAL